MFKCSECKRLYKERVDYCDCGNNEFEEVQDTPQPSQKAAPANSPAAPVPTMITSKLLSIILHLLILLVHAFFPMVF